MAEREILIREATFSDLDGIFHLYNNYMFDSYLSRFGGIFVKRYLSLIIDSKDCITLVAEERKDRAVGFIMATMDTKKIMIKLLFDAGILWAGLRQILFHPIAVLKGMELGLYPFKAHLKSVDAEFLFIAVEPEYRKINLGIELIKKTVTIMELSGIKKVKVSTIARNEVVNSLLRKLGFKVERTFMMFGKGMYLYSYETARAFPFSLTNCQR